MAGEIQNHKRKHCCRTPASQNDQHVARTASRGRGRYPPRNTTTIPSFLDMFLVFSTVALVLSTCQYLPTFLVSGALPAELPHTTDSNLDNGQKDSSTLMRNDAHNFGDNPWSADIDNDTNNNDNDPFNRVLDNNEDTTILIRRTDPNNFGNSPPDNDNNNNDDDKNYNNDSSNRRLYHICAASDFTYAPMYEYHYTSSLATTSEPTTNFHMTNEMRVRLLCGDVVDGDLSVETQTDLESAILEYSNDMMGATGCGGVIEFDAIVITEFIEADVCVMGRGRSFEASIRFNSIGRCTSSCPLYFPSEDNDNARRLLLEKSASTKKRIQSDAISSRELHQQYRRQISGNAGADDDDEESDLNFDTYFASVIRDQFGFSTVFTAQLVQSTPIDCSIYSKDCRVPSEDADLSDYPCCGADARCECQFVSESLCVLNGCAIGGGLCCEVFDDDGSPVYPPCEGTEHCEAIRNITFFETFESDFDGICGDAGNGELFDDTITSLETALINYFSDLEQCDEESGGNSDSNQVTNPTEIDYPDLTLTVVSVTLVAFIELEGCVDDNTVTGGQRRLQRRKRSRGRFNRLKKANNRRRRRRSRKRRLVDVDQATGSYFDFDASGFASFLTQYDENFLHNKKSGRRAQTTSCDADLVESLMEQGFIEVTSANTSQAELQICNSTSPTCTGADESYACCGAVGCACRNASLSLCEATDCSLPPDYCCQLYQDDRTYVYPECFGSAFCIALEREAIFSTFEVEYSSTLCNVTTEVTLDLEKAQIDYFNDLEQCEEDELNSPIPSRALSAPDVSHGDEREKLSLVETEPIKERATYRMLLENRVDEILVPRTVYVVLVEFIPADECNVTNSTVPLSTNQTNRLLQRRRRSRGRFRRKRGVNRRRNRRSRKRRRRRMKTQADPGTVTDRGLQVTGKCDANLTESLADQGVMVEEAEVTEETTDTCLDASSGSCTGMDGQFSCCDTAFPECACSDQASTSFCLENACISEVAVDLCCKIEMGGYLYPECAQQCATLPSPCSAFTFLHSGAPLSYGLVVDVSVDFICSDGPGSMLSTEREELLEDIMADYAENLYDFYGCGDGIVVDRSELNSFSEPDICTDPSSVDRYANMTFTIAIMCVGRCPTELPEEPDTSSSFPTNDLRSRRILNEMAILNPLPFSEGNKKASVRRQLNEIQCTNVTSFTEALMDCGNFTNATDSIFSNRGRAAGSPSTMPSSEPSLLPSSISLEPSDVPSGVPSSEPNSFPSNSPSSTPSSKPSSSPSSDPSGEPSSPPSLMISVGPSSGPSSLPSIGPSSDPSIDPTSIPSSSPSIDSSFFPSAYPSSEPSKAPSFLPSSLPSPGPSSFPSTLPSFVPSSTPSVFPSLEPSSNPSYCFGPKHYFPLDQANQFTDIIDGVTVLEDKGGAINGQKYRFLENQGLAFQNFTCTDVWTISFEVYVKDYAGAWNKLVDFCNLKEDYGLYHYDDKGLPYPCTYFFIGPFENETGLCAETGEEECCGPCCEGPCVCEFEECEGMECKQPITIGGGGGVLVEEVTNIGSNENHRKYRNGAKARNRRLAGGGVTAEPTPSPEPSSTPSVGPSLGPTVQPSDMPSSEPSSKPSSSPSSSPSSDPSSSPSSMPSPAPTIMPEKDVIVISRDSSKRLSLYVNGERIWQGTDVCDRMVFQKFVIQFLQDDTNFCNQCEAGRGWICNIWIWERALTKDEVLQAYFKTGRTFFPSSDPSSDPSSEPSLEPSLSSQPSSEPSTNPSLQPSDVPSGEPSNFPSSQPSSDPSTFPSLDPSSQPSSQPSSDPSIVPSFAPNAEPSSQPSSDPSIVPSFAPNAEPSSQPSSDPSIVPSFGFGGLA